jgi:hypothetical protein
VLSTSATDNDASLQPFAKHRSRRVVVRILMLDEPPDEIGPYSIAYHIKHGS